MCLSQSPLCQTVCQPTTAASYSLPCTAGKGLEQHFPESLSLSGLGWIQPMRGSLLVWKAEVSIL